MGLEVELRTAIKEAYAAIEQLKELGLSLSSPIVDELALSGRPLIRMPLKVKLEHASKISSTLKTLGASEREIEEVTSTLYGQVLETHIAHILSSLQKSNSDKATVFNGWQQWGLNEWNMGKVEDFINTNRLRRDDETEESIRDFEYFVKTKKLRREDRF